MVNHGQTQPCKIVGRCKTLAFARDDHRQVIGIRCTQAQPSVCSLKAVGAAQYVHTSFMQRLNGLITAIETLYFDGYTQQLSDDADVIRCQTFVVTGTYVDIKWWIVRP